MEELKGNETPEDVEASEEKVEELSRAMEPDLAEGYAPAGGEEPADAQDPNPRMILEALLFASSAPVNASRLAEVSIASPGEVAEIIEALNAEYRREKRAFHIIEVAGGYQMMTRSRFYPFIQRLVKTRTHDKLSQAGLETLAIIAYKQPIIRADIEAVRGVQSGQILRNLLERRLVRVVGRDERLGRPLLYGTTKHFLEVFGLKSLKELPTIEELKAF